MISVIQKSISYKIICYALPIYSGTLIVSLAGFSNILYLSKVNHANSYILSAYLPCYFFLLAFQETWRSMTIAAVSKYKSSQSLRSLIVALWCIALVSSLMLLFLYELIKIHLIDWLDITVYQHLFNVFTEKMFIAHLFAVNNALFSSVLLALGFPLFSACINITTSLTVMLIVQFYWGPIANSLYLYSLAYLTVNVLMTVVLITIFMTNWDTLNYLVGYKLQNLSHVILQYMQKIGLPVFLLWLVMLFGTYVFNNILSQCNISVMTGYSLVYRLQILVFQPALSLGIAIGVLVNYQLSRQLFHEAWKIITTGMKLSLCIYLLIGFLLYCLRHSIAYYFATDPIVQHVVQECLSYVALGWCISGPVISWMTLLEQNGYAALVTAFHFSYFLSMQFAVKHFVLPTHDPHIFYQILLIASLLSILIFLIFPILKKKIISHS